MHKNIYVKRKSIEYFKIKYYNCGKKEGETTIMFKKTMLVLAVALLAGVLGTYWELVSDSAPVSNLADDSLGENQPTEYYAVYVCGAVQNPGVVLLNPTSRISDAINSCGGLLPNADAEGINLAEAIKDGMQIIVRPKHIIATSPADGQKGEAAAGTTGEGKININRANLDELTKIPGVGKATAQRIIDYRTQNGSFSSIDDLKKIKGIGASKFEKMAPKITI